MVWVFGGILGVIGVLWALRWVARTDAVVVAGVLQTLIRLVLTAIGMILSGGRFWLVGLLLRGLFARRSGGAYRAYERARAQNRARGREYQRGRVSGQAMSLSEARRILQVGQLASEEEITQAWRNLMRKAHPDMGGKAEDAVLINQARDILLKNR